MGKREAIQRLYLSRSQYLSEEILHGSQSTIIAIAVIAVAVIAVAVTAIAVITRVQ